MNKTGSSSVGFWVSPSFYQPPSTEQDQSLPVPIPSDDDTQGVPFGEALLRFFAVDFSFHPLE